jgi:hypothetical protein
MKLMLVNDSGEVVDSWDLADMDLSKSFAQADLCDDIQNQINRVESQEIEE